ncbi:hypothetical protein [Feifania hominis]|uniref:Uncharacterized protein n=1 Tax=Feifania hominis TaxID=2763660 RepID=A0A926DFD2_9FIRM|nr:hypothetical protein [Feifania hominis]MBC8536832.1 hypothetical protein [Feifania hominis]
MAKLNAAVKNQIKNRVFYNKDEKGMDTSPEVHSDITLQIAYIQIGFQTTDMCANQVYGLSPSTSWIRKKLEAPVDVKECALKLEEDYDYGTWQLDDSASPWKSYYDSDTGWFCVGDSRPYGGWLNIKFLDNAIACLNREHELQALWIHL